MLQNLFKDKKTVFLITFCLVGFALLRYYETSLFYDPFLAYFKRDYLNLPFPEFNNVALFWNMFLRYFINSFISLMILFFLFNDLSLIKFVIVLYILLFFILIGGFFIVLLFLDESYNFLLFYLRRFLIQPLFLLLFIPAFYLQKKQH
ncbi:exosortase F system-associated membrane protein [Flavobacterium sp.]|jgi:exosortase F-associated protein|uniref:exosortase F system-associated membrane protein n=1 Tax=Flavobacterium sp. TaxID=239 RepID=UPI0037BF20DA